MKLINTSELISVTGGEGLFYDLGYAYWNFVGSAVADLKDFAQGIADGFESTQSSDNSSNESSENENSGG